MATKTSYEVEIKTIGGQTLTVTGDPANAVYTALWKGHAAKYYDSTNSVWMLVPYHAVDSAKVTITNESAQDPEDATCNE